MADWQRRWRLPRRRWRLQGCDAFAGEVYPLPGAYWTEKGAQRAARRFLRRIERMQPSAISGGQKRGAIQDRVYVVRPDGSVYRFPPADESC